MIYKGKALFPKELLSFLSIEFGFLWMDLLAAECDDMGSGSGVDWGQSSVVSWLAKLAS